MDRKEIGSFERGEDTTSGSFEKEEIRRYRKGNEVARASRYDGLNDPKLRELLPELSDHEIEVLGENIENAIVDTVVRKLREQRE